MSNPTNFPYAANFPYPANFTYHANFTYPANFTYRANFTYPVNLKYPANFTYPANYTYPANFTYPANYTYPANFTLLLIARTWIGEIKNCLLPRGSWKPNPRMSVALPPTIYTSLTNLGDINAFSKIKWYFI